MEKKKDGRPKEIIHLHNAARFYHMGGNLVKAVDEMNICVKEGDFVAIMGPSG